jgi:hypothetical protein
MFNESMGNTTDPYARNFGGMGGNMNVATFLQCPIYSFDLTKKEIGDWIGSSADITLGWELAAGAGVDAWLYAVVTTEGEVALDMTAHRAVAQVIKP